MIRSDIPFYPSFATQRWPEGEHCVQMCLKMLLAVLMPAREFTLRELEDITHKAPESGAFTTHHLIWLVDQGFEVQRWDAHDWPAFRDEGLEYIRRTMGEEAAAYNAQGYDIDYERSVVDEFLAKVPMINLHPTVDVMEEYFNKGWLIRVAVNLHTLNHLEGYMGHSVIVVGFDGTDVIIHDPGLPALEARRVPRILFQEAVDSFGGEMDAVRPKPF